MEEVLNADALRHTQNFAKSDVPTLGGIPPSARSAFREDCVNHPTEEAITAYFGLITTQNIHLIKELEKERFDGFIKLDPTLNKATVFLHRVHEIIVTFPQGAFPINLAYEAVKTTLKLLRRCRMRYGRVITKKMEQEFHKQIRLWFYQGAPKHPPRLFAKKIFDGENQLINVICDFNLAIGHVAPAADEKPATKKDVESIVKTAAKSTDEKLNVVMVGQSETAAVVNRIDSRTKKIAKERKSTARFSVAVQELCHTYWVKGQHLPEIKANCRGKVSHKAVFEYFKRELSQHGIKTAADFHAALDLRSKRISKQTDAN